MKKSELRKLIRQAIKEQIGPSPGPLSPAGTSNPKKPRPNVSSVNANQIGLTTPVLGWDCADESSSAVLCMPVYDIPMNANVTPAFTTQAECMESGACVDLDLNPDRWWANYDGAQGMSPSLSKRNRRRR